MSGGGSGASPSTSAPAGGSTTSTGGFGGLLAPLAQQLTAQGQNFGGGFSVSPAISTPWGTTQQSKADYYNQQLGAGLTDAQIRANVESNPLGGAQSNSDWSYLVQQAGMQSPTGRPLPGSGQFYQPQYQPQYQNYNTGNAMGVSQYGQMPNMFSMQTPFTFGGQQMGGGYGMYGMNNPYSPYSNSFLNMPSNLNQMGQADKVGFYQNAMDRGFNDQQLYNQASGLFGYQSPQDWSYLQNQAAQTAPAQTPFRSSGPSQPIVSRSAGIRGTPNVMRRAEGGIASLVDDE